MDLREKMNAARVELDEIKSRLARVERETDELSSEEGEAIAHLKE